MKHTPQEQLFNKRTLSLYHASKKRAGYSDFTLAELREMLNHKRDRNPFCPYCQQPLSIDIVSLDHLHPLSRGGKNNLENIHFICKSCNSSKGQMNHFEHKFLLEYLDSWEQRCRNFSLREKLLTSLRVANSFRIGANRRGKR